MIVVRFIFRNTLYKLSYFILMYIYAKALSYLSFFFIPTFMSCEIYIAKNTICYTNKKLNIMKFVSN